VERDATRLKVGHYRPVGPGDADLLRFRLNSRSVPMLAPAAKVRAISTVSWTPRRRTSQTMKSIDQAGPEVEIEGADGMVGDEGGGDARSSG